MLELVSDIDEQFDELESAEDPDEDEQDELELEDWLDNDRDPADDIS